MGTMRRRKDESRGYSTCDEVHRRLLTALVSSEAYVSSQWMCCYRGIIVSALILAQVFNVFASDAGKFSHFCRNVCWVLDRCIAFEVVLVSEVWSSSGYSTG